MNVRVALGVICSLINHWDDSDGVLQAADDDDFDDDYKQQIVQLLWMEDIVWEHGPGPCCLSLSSYLNNSLPLYLTRTFSITRWDTAAKRNCHSKRANSDTTDYTIYLEAPTSRNSAYNIILNTIITDNC